MNFHCASAQEEGSKEKKGCGGKERGRRKPPQNSEYPNKREECRKPFESKAKRHRGSVVLIVLVLFENAYAVLRGRPRPRLGSAARAMSFGSWAGMKSGYFAMLFSRMAMRRAMAVSATLRGLPLATRRW